MQWKKRQLRQPRWSGHMFKNHRGPSSKTIGFPNAQNCDNADGCTREKPIRNAFLLIVYVPVKNGKI